MEKLSCLASISQYLFLQPWETLLSALSFWDVISCWIFPLNFPSAKIITLRSSMLQRKVNRLYQMLDIKPLLSDDPVYIQPLLFHILRSLQNFWFSTFLHSIWTLFYGASLNWFSIFNLTSWIIPSMCLSRDTFLTLLEIWKIILLHCIS